MADFVTWVRALPGLRVFTAHPLAFDGQWIDHYLRAFVDLPLVRGRYDPDPLFHDTLCLRSYAAAVTGRYVGDVSPATLPGAWFGDVPHTHRALDDALGYAHLLAELLRRSEPAPAG